MLIRLFISAALIIVAASVFISIRGILEARLSWENDQPCLTVELFNPWFKNRRLARVESSLSNLPMDGFISLCQSSKIDLMKRTLTGINKARLLLKMLVIQRLEWKSVAGMGDAMSTALLNGGLWAFKGWVVGWISRQARLQQLDLNVKPDFSGKSFESRLYCIFKIRLVHIIFMIVYLLALKAFERPKPGCPELNQTRG